MKRTETVKRRMRLLDTESFRLSTGDSEMAIERTRIADMVKEGVSFTVIPETGLSALTDCTAIAIWVYLLTKQDTWSIREMDIRKRLRIGKDKYYAAMRELRDCGLMYDIQERNVDGSFKHRELVCKDMPLRPRKLDSRIRLKSPCSGKPGVRETSNLSNTGETFSNTGEEKLFTDVNNPAGFESLEKTIEQATSRYATRQLAMASNTRATRQSTIALWNLTLSEHYPGTVSPPLSKTIKFSLANNIKNLNLPEGTWQTVMKFSIQNWDELRITNFKWMQKPPMPSAPSFPFWQRLFRFFYQAFLDHREDRDDVQVMSKLGVFRKDSQNTKEVQALREENDRLRRAQEQAQDTSTRLLNAVRQTKMELEKVQKDNTQLRRRTRKVVDIDEEIESWEERNAR